MPDQPGAAAGGADTAQVAVLDRIIDAGKMIRAEDQRVYAGQMIGTFAREFAEKEPDKVTNNLVSAVQQRISEIDRELSEWLSLLMHDERFQKLEASWRGLHSLVKNTETGTELKLRLLHATGKELLDDVEKSVDFDQRVLFKKVYEEEYGTFGGAPYGVLVGDYSFGRSPQDMKLMEGIAETAAAAHAPFIAAADPKLFDMGSFTELGVPRDLAKIFESVEMANWRAFRQKEDSRYVALVLPRVLMRLPYGKDTVPVEQFAFEETGPKKLDPVGKEARTKLKAAIAAEEAARKAAEAPDASDEVKAKAEEAKKAADEARAEATASAVFLPQGEERDQVLHRQFLWGNPAYFLAQRITAAFASYRWTAAIRGYEGGGKVESLPVHVFTTDEGDLAMKCPTEVTITDRREKELNDLGFIALCHRKGENCAVFFGGATVQKPVSYNTDQANANARLSALLPYVLAASRFAHYLKVMVREKVGSFESRTSLEKYLNTWIAGYVLLNDDAPQSAKARFPLREARVDVTEVPGKPGAYRATVFLRPHFQLEELTASIRLVAELPAPPA